MPTLPATVRRRLVPWSLVLAVVSLAAAWTVASPVGGTPDESAHIDYAWAVATGQTLPWTEKVNVDENGTWLTDVEVPVGLGEYEDTTCYAGDATASPTCGWVPSSDATALVRRGTYMTRYPPLYYAIEGVVLRTGLEAGLSGHRTLLAARFISGLMSLGMITGAAVVLRRRFPGPAVAIALLAGLTPVALSLATAINPNGFEISAAVLSAALVVAVRHDHTRTGRVGTGLLTGLVAVSVALTWTRPLSLVWSVLLLGVLLMPGGPVPSLLRSRRGRIGAVLVGVTVAGAAAWLLFARQTRTIGQEDGAADWSTFGAPMKAIMTTLKFGDLLQQMIGFLGWDTTLPGFVVLGWALTTMLAVTALTTGAVRASTRTRDALLFGAASCAAVSGYTFLTAFGWQGRYLLPAVAATLVLLVPSMQGRALGGATRARAGLATAVFLLLTQLGALVWWLWRYMYGVDPYYKRFSSLPLPSPPIGWFPPLGQVVIIALGVVGVAALGYGLLGTMQSSRMITADADATDAAPHGPDRPLS